VVEQALLVARVGFVVLLYLFIWRVVRLSARDIRAPQDSMILSAEAARAAGLGVPQQPASSSRAANTRLVVVASPVFPTGTVILVEQDITFGRSATNDVMLDADDTASASHARVFIRDGEPHLEDLGSTNGTFVNDQQLLAERLLRIGDRVQIGATELRYEAAA
jgi:pSer/pThr/pTyr-binding forkhead associated (FHA) protein